MEHMRDVGFDPQRANKTFFYDGASLAINYKNRMFKINHILGAPICKRNSSYSCYTDRTF